MTSTHPTAPPRRGRRGPRPLRWAAAALALLFCAPLAAQEEPAEGEANGALRVFFDCSAGGVCDFDFYRREIPFVNYTRDREDAQVHVLLTSEQTGGGGRRFTLDFIGREQFAGIDDRLTTTTRANLAEEQELTQVARSMAQGLMRYVARTEESANIRISYEGETGGARQTATPEDDPWDFWTFRVRANTNLNIDERTESIRLGGGASASRITEGLKLEFDVGGNYNESQFEINDSTSVTSIRRSYDAEGLMAWSLSDHWSIGAAYELGHSTFSNEDLRARVTPALEYNLFPYSESTRRQFSFLYRIGVSHFQYIEETVFFKTEETLPQHSLSASLSLRQPWGGTFGFLEFSQFLNDLSKNRFEVFGGAEFRLFRGLSLNFNGSAERVRDQINLPAGDATEEEILLFQRELATGFRYRLSVGFSYTFGSIFSNVVNPRFERF